MTRSARADRFLAACRREPTDATPVWLMRQAGRYMPEYRALRERYGILEIIGQPELATEVTMQPVRAFDVDAAIIFADILPLVAGMGLDLEFVKGEGPVIHNPLRREADILALRDPPLEESVGGTFEAIRMVRRELADRVALIGFSGAPFTLASYAVEGGSSRAHERVKSLMNADSAAWHRLMERVAERVGRYLLQQAECGAQALQIFDSWAGALSPADYRDAVLPHTRRAIEVAEQAAVPVIHFTTGTAGYLEAVAEAGADVVSVDWRIDLRTAWDRLGAHRGIQGNLDPVKLLGPWESLARAADGVLEAAAGQAGHIFNLGHGVLQSTEPAQVRRLVDHVHSATARHE